MIQRPQLTDYHPFYQSYVQHIPDHSDVLELLQKQQQEMQQVVGRVGENEADFAYAPGKWSIREVVGHMNDTERIMAYRALSVARGEQQVLPGFDENDYVAHSNFRERTISSLLEEHALIRANTRFLFLSFAEEAYARRGNANGSPVTVAALAFIIAGHERHHLNLLKERYLARL